MSRGSNQPKACSAKWEREAHCWQIQSLVSGVEVLSRWQVVWYQIPLHLLVGGCYCHCWAVPRVEHTICIILLWEESSVIEKVDNDGKRWDGRCREVGARVKRSSDWAWHSEGQTLVLHKFLQFQSWCCTQMALCNISTGGKCYLPFVGMCI